MISDTDRKNAMNTIIIAQCFGQVAGLCFVNGLMFNYLTSLNISEQAMVIYLRLPSIIGLFITLPMAYLSDAKGKSKLGQIGNAIQVVGLGCLCMAAYVSGYQSLAVVGGILLFSIGVALFNCSWFALLDPIIKPEQRGSFFAKLRTIWKLFGVTFTFIAQLILEIQGDSVLSPLLMAVAVLAVIRMYYYQKIPELEPRVKQGDGKHPSFKSEIKDLFKNKDFLTACILSFFMPIFFGELTLLFNFYEKLILKFDSPDIVLMGNLAMIGGVCGFSAGAFGLKKMGEKKLFMICTIMVSACLLFFPLHNYFNWIPTRVYAGFFTFLSGLSTAAMSIGITSMMLHLLPQKNKSLETSLFLTAQEIGAGVSAGILSLAIYFFEGSTKTLSVIHVNVYTVYMAVLALIIPIGIYLFNKKLKM